MPRSPVSSLAARRLPSRASAILASLAVLVLGLPIAMAAPQPGEDDVVGETIGHLVLSELMTGGESASDEFVEIYNPSAGPLPLEGLEVVYVSASGATVTRKASWEAGAAEVPPGAHLLIANEAGVFAPIAEATYANGLAATGGSLALRIVGASTAIDAVGWGTAASSWLEASPAAAPAAGQSLERLPGGAQGSGQDTDANAADFVVREMPDPQNSASPPIPDGDPMPTPAETPLATPEGTPAPTPMPTPLPTPLATPEATPGTSEPVTIAMARALPDDTPVTIEGTALTDHDFADGGGFVADATGGIAVLLADGTYHRGALLRISGTLDDRFAQRTLRAAGTGVTVLGDGTEGAPLAVSTGDVAEALEGVMVRVSGPVVGAPTALASGLAYGVDDGSGEVRVLVGPATGIDTSDWIPDASVELIGVVGQRDSSGTGLAGYRVMPRDAADLVSVIPPGTDPPGATATPQPSISPPPDGTVLTIGQARDAATNETVRVRGVVTMAPGLVEPGSATLQDATGGILLRLGDEAGSVALGAGIEVEGKRSTFGGMLSIRVVEPPPSLAAGDPPAPLRRPTGEVGEPDEARLLVVRGAISGSVQRSTAGNVYFDLDDGSGPVRVYVSPRSGIDTGALVSGAWMEITGVLFQETTGRQPERGYRIWPRAASDVQMLAAPVSNVGVAGPGASESSDSGASTVIAGPAGSGAASAAVSGRQPRLAVALPTASAVAALVQPAASGEPAQGRPWAAAALLLAATGLSGAGGGVVLGRDGLARLRDRVMGLVSGPREGSEMRNGEEPKVPSAPVSGPPAMVPLAIEPQPGQRPPSLSVVDGGGRTHEHGRILPPT